MRKRVRCTLVILCAATVPLSPLHAQSSSSTALQEQLKAAWAAAAKTAISGPAQIRLLDEATLNIDASEIFIPAAQANGIMAALGNSSTPSRFGLVVAKKDDSPWMVDIDWIHEGYVRDGEAKDWQPDAMLDDLKSGTEQGNTERLAKGLPALDVTGWVEKPTYDARSHRLVWSLALRDRGAPASEPQTINYNTYALGRDGYFSLDLITGSDTVGADKQVARDLLANLSYLPGKRYEDFSSSTDKVAAYGIAALVGVVAVKKLGLLAMLGVFFVKVWKLGAIALAAAAGAFRRFFKREAPGEAA